MDQSAKWDNITSEILDLGTEQTFFYVKTNDANLNFKRKTQNPKRLLYNIITVHCTE